MKSSGIFVSSSSQGAGTDAGTQLPGNFTWLQLFRQQQSTSILLKLPTLLSGLHYRSGYPCSQRMLNKLHKSTKEEPLATNTGVVRHTYI